MVTSTRHLPLITACIEFSEKPNVPLPSITSDLDFDAPSQIEVDTLSERGTSPSVLSDSGSSNNDVTATSDNKIPQPFGQPGRPGSGGHSVRQELAAWGEELLDEFTVFVQTACDTHLNTSKSYSKQGKGPIGIVCSVTKNRFPIVNKYENLWPVHDIMKMYLKKTSEAYRKLRGGRR
ncbi:hypothetical protein CVT24_002472 [Panaeolus cyanescens]|uniref:Uncharacterized protein n=1 Tax=Panaeolus cyanescens TaxID=181874 RepID=A0A409WVG7_9AGAR|nr:hypothetical protein CVT24_002472 [Panaeolus cyanescens]